LVVVVDDLFVSPMELPKDYLEPTVAEGIAARECRSVSGVLLLNPVNFGGSIEYRKYFIQNMVAEHPLPDAVSKGLFLGNSDPQGPRWLKE
jgi:hypothetical protein